MDDYKEDLKRIAHMISDSEDKSFDETKAKKELEKLTEIEIQKKRYNCERNSKDAEEKFEVH